MNIRQLKQFVAVAQLGNISRSAEQQNISQPALTRSLKNLEEDLGVQLIERRANGVFLTAYGEHLLEYAQNIVNDSERVKREISAMASGKRGKLNIGVGPAYSGPSIAHAIDKLLGKGSQLELHLVEGFVEDLCADLRSGSLDVVLSLFPENYDLSDLGFTRLCNVQSVLVASPEHPVAKLKNASRYQLAQFNWVIPDQKYAGISFREYLNRVEIPASANHVRVNSLRLIKSLVCHSDYLTVLPRMLVEEELASGLLVRIDAQAKPSVSLGGLAYRSSGFRTPALREFIQIVESDSNASFAAQGASGKNSSVYPIFRS